MAWQKIVAKQLAEYNLLHEYFNFRHRDMLDPFYIKSTTFQFKYQLHDTCQTKIKGTLTFTKLSVRKNSTYCNYSFRLDSTVLLNLDDWWIIILV